MQLSFYVLYSTALTLALVQGYTWVSETHTIGDAYLRSLAFALAMLLTLTALPIAMKWLLIGRWEEESIPIWSVGYFRFWLAGQSLEG
jgi:hypothetical protein